MTPTSNIFFFSRYNNNNNKEEEEKKKKKKKKKKKNNNNNNNNKTTESIWTNLSNSFKPAAELHHIQKAWDGRTAENHRSLILCRASCDVDKARFLAVSSPHAGDWLHEPPITAVGLRLSDEAVRVAVAHRLGCKACVPHTCVCGKPVDARGLHGLSCRRSAPRQQRHSQLNGIIWRALKRA